MKKITYILLPSLIIHLTGCYSMFEINKEELKENKNNAKIIIITKENKTYQFEEGEYFVRKDSLLSNMSTVNGESSARYTEKIPLEDIDQINIEKVDGVKTLFLILGVAAIAAFVVVVVEAVIVGSAFSNFSNAN